MTFSIKVSSSLTNFQELKRWIGLLVKTKKNTTSMFLVHSLQKKLFRNLFKAMKELKLKMMSLTAYMITVS